MSCNCVVLCDCCVTDLLGCSIEGASWGKSQFLAVKLPEALSMYTTAVYTGYAGGATGLRLYLFGGTLSNQTRSNALFSLDAASHEEAERFKAHYFGPQTVTRQATFTGSLTQSWLDAQRKARPSSEPSMTATSSTQIPAISGASQPSTAPQATSDSLESLADRLSNASLDSLSSAPVFGCTSPRVSPRCSSSLHIADLVRENDHLRTRVAELERENASLNALLHNMQLKQQQQQQQQQHAHCSDSLTHSSSLMHEERLIAAARIQRGIEDIQSAMAILGLNR
jgi:hypothetical protein